MTLVSLFLVGDEAEQKCKDYSIKLLNCPNKLREEPGDYLGKM